GIADWFESHDCNDPNRNSCRTGTDPNNPDSDGDGWSDGFEVKIWCDPCFPNQDLNGNGVPDECEQLPKFSQRPCDCNGDVNKDGVIDDFDVEIVTNCVNARSCADCVNSCDVDCNKSVDQGDIDTVICLASGLPPERCCRPGEDYPSDLDWRDMVPNQVVADDFVSDGRPITSVRWWGSNRRKDAGDIEVDFFSESKATVDINTPLGSETITLIGPTTVHVFLGSLGDKQPNGLEDVSTEIVSMALTGNSTLLGPIIMRVRPVTSKPFQRSTGQIEEKTNDIPGVVELTGYPGFAGIGSALSSFDVFFEIEVLDTGLILHNEVPKHQETQITEKPPAEGEVYENPDIIRLFDENNNFWGQVKNARHTPRPRPVPKECEQPFSPCPDGNPNINCICLFRPDGTTNCADASEAFGCVFGQCRSDDECTEPDTKCFVEDPGISGCCAHNCPATAGAVAPDDSAGAVSVHAPQPPKPSIDVALIPALGTDALAATPTGADGPPQIRFAQATWEQMGAFDAAHPAPGAQVAPFPKAPPPQAAGGAGAPAGQQGRLTPGDSEGGPPAPLAPPLTNSFAGTIDDGTFIPPDTNGAVGLTFIAEMLNSGFQVFDRGGGVVAPQITHQAFWSSLGTLPGQPASFVFDPKTLYDQYTDRFVVTASGWDGGPTAWVLVGISQSNTPTGLWNLFAIQASINDVAAGVDHTNDFAEFPGLGLDPNNVIVTNNVFTMAGAFVHSDVWVISKASMIAGGPLVQGVDYALFHDPCGTGGFTFRPCHTFGQNRASAVNYLVDQGWLDSATTMRRFLRIKSITGVGAAAALNCQRGNDWIEVNGYNFSQLDAPQPFCSALINTNDTRLLNAVLWKDTIWTTHSVGAGVVPLGALPSKPEVAWYEIDPAQKGAFPGGVPNQQGRVSDPDLYYYYPSIAVNKDLCVALGFSGSDENTFASAYYTAHDPAVDLPGVTQAVSLLKAGVDSYLKTFQSPSQRNRWGDYSITVVDPRDLHTFWTLQEYAEEQFPPAGPPPSFCEKDAGRWGTWWGSFQCENSIDGWFISFHEPLQKDDSQNEPLALYYCDVKVVDIQPTKLPDCQDHQVYEYFVDLDSCCLVHANFDSRTDRIPAMKDAFYEEKHLQYHIDIQAVIGVKYTQDKDTGECIEKKTRKGAFADFWGWHTTINEEGRKPALQSFVKMGPLGEWLYGPWVNVQPKCSFPNMAFELLTTQPPTPGGCCFTSRGASVCRVMTQEECALKPNSTFLGFDNPCPEGPQAQHDGVVVTHFTSPPLACHGGSGGPLRGNACIEHDGPIVPIDPWVTSEGGQMCHQFGIDPDSPTIPADFFEPGSDPFDGQVCLENDTLGLVTLPGYPADLDFGQADTLIQRSSDPFDRCDLPGAAEVTVETEIVALSLKSVVPMTVVVSGQDTTWDVNVDLSAVTPPPGSFTAVKEHCNGGTYTSELHVQPRFTFTKVSGPGIPLGSVAVLDTGLEGIPFVTLTQPAVGQPDPPWTNDLQPEEVWQSPVCTDVHPSMEDPNPTNACDCNVNGQRDKCDIEQGISDDNIDSDGNPNPDGIPDECQEPCIPPDFMEPEMGVSFSDRAWDGFIDARRESNDGTDVNQGLDTITIEFTTAMQNADGTPISAAAFSISDTAGTPPAIVNATSADGGKTVTLALSDHLTLQHWTTISFNGRSACNEDGFAGEIDIGFLPCDVNQDGRCNPLDVTKFRQYVNDIIEPDIGIEDDYTDINRNGSTNPLDLTGLRQLVFGTGLATKVWAGEVLPAQP
ncbi:MAG: dockerin type I domain-containing protein, partial [Phycisphaerae bacterium]